EGMQGLPVLGAVQANEGLGDGLLLGVEGQAGDPLDEALLAAAGEADGDRQQDGLPERPQQSSLHRAPPGGSLVGRHNRQAPPGRGPCQSACFETWADGWGGGLGFTGNYLLIRRGG